MYRYIKKKEYTTTPDDTATNQLGRFFFVRVNVQTENDDVSFLSFSFHMGGETASESLCNHTTRREIRDHEHVVSLSFSQSEVNGKNSLTLRVVLLRNWWDSLLKKKEVSWETGRRYKSFP